MSAYVDDTDEPSASLYISRAPGSSSMRASQTGRPFLSMLNPMGRSYAGYRHPSDVVEEEDEDEEGTIHMTSTQHDNAALGRTHSTDTALDDADEIPASLMIETDRPRRSSKQQFPEFNAPPRPSELIQPALPQPAVASSPKPMRGMDEYERALWNWFNVYNLDAFLQEVYAYYEGKGIYCIALSKGLNLLTVGFVIGFSTFLLGCVDYSRIRHTGTTQLADVVIPHCVSRFSGFTWLFFMLFGAFYIYQILQFALSMRRLLELYQFYTHLLGVPDSDIQTISWPEIVRRIGLIRDQNPITALSNTTSASPTNATTTAKLDAHDIANRIMRQENYLIALFDRGLLDLRVPLPRFLQFGNEPGQQTLTRALEWNLRACLLGHLFDHRGTVRTVFLKEKNRAGLAAELKRRMIFFGLVNAIFAPFIVLYLMMHSFFRYFEEYHKNPSSLGTRQYTPFAKWTFREYNELPHIFARRLDNSYPAAIEYIDQFPKEQVTIIARFVSFVAGSFAAVLILASVLDSDIFLHFEITPGKTVVFYITVFSSVVAITRGMVPDPHRVFDPEMLLREVVRHTHYLPPDWEGQLHSKMVHTKFGTLFAVKATIFVQELTSVLLTPFILWYSLPPSAEKIVDFFREFTWHVDGLGYVCSSAVFDLKRHGHHAGETVEGAGAGAGTGLGGSTEERFAGKEGKMEKSFLNFKAANPEWNPSDPTGSLYLSRINTHAHAHAHPDRSVLGRTRSRSRFGQHYAQTHAQPHTHSTAIQPRPGSSVGFAAEVVMPESKLADRAAMYERALQNSVKLRSSSGASGSRRLSGGAESASAPVAASIDVGSALGESYDDAQPVFAKDVGKSGGGGRRDDEEEGEGEGEEEFVDGGIMGLLGNIYEQRRTVL
ncbi:autophagy protein atg9 [Ceratobasidium sp. 428]|nr:autophagy protein atg9 [Ceratobasidium sp. 428]